MKIAALIGDGMGDYPLVSLSGQRIQSRECGKEFIQGEQAMQKAGSQAMVQGWGPRGSLVLLLAAVLLEGAAPCTADFVRPPGAPSDVLPEYHNLEVTALSEDSESARMALGAAWNDALACRAFSGYLRPWTKDDFQQEAEQMVRRGTAMFELMASVDHGIKSVRLARDSRNEPNLMKDVKFWRNELSLAAGKVSAYGEDAAALKATLRGRLMERAAERHIASKRIEGIPWAEPQREAWRAAGPATGVRLPLVSYPGSLPEWWNQNLSLAPGYIATKLGSAGDSFFTPELPIGAWGYNCVGEGQYDWTDFNSWVTMLKERRLKLLLELPTLRPATTDAEARKKAAGSGPGQRLRYAPSLPEYLTNNPGASLIVRNPDGTTQPHGGVQLLNPQVAAAYGEYLKAMARNLKRQGLYDTIAAVHLEEGASAVLPETADYSDPTLKRWRAFMQKQYGDVAALNRAAGTKYKSFDDLPLPARTLNPATRNEWTAFAKPSERRDAEAWGQYLLKKFNNVEGIRKALGDDFREGDGWRVPVLEHPPVIGIDYLHFRSAWVKEYLSVKRALVSSAFPDKLAIAEMWQMGDHGGLGGASEEKMGGFLDDDWAQWTGVGPENENKPFMIRSVGPVGHGTRLSDSIESLFRDYLWINFRGAGNLVRYLYIWVAYGYMDYQFGWHSITSHWLTNYLVYQLGPTVANTAPEPQRIGVLLPRATYDLFEGDIYYELLGWDWLLHAAKLSYTRIDEPLVRHGGLEGLKLEALILPDVRAMDAKVAEEIKKWVAAGGLLIASAMPGKMDEYGRPLERSPLAEVLGTDLDGATCEAVKDTPLTITIPHGIFSGHWAETTDRKPLFEVLKPTTGNVMARYESGKPAITVNQYGKGRAVLIGYPFGREAVECDRTSVGFYRTYTCFVREPQLVARTKWLREFIVDKLGYTPQYGVDFAEVGRYKGHEALSLGLGCPKGFSETPGDEMYVRTFGDPRRDHELEVEHEVPDMAVRFYPRHREGLATHYLGISTREVHYIAPRAAVNIYLSKRTYHCRINNPRIQAIWDVVLDAPVGFARDERGVSFDTQLPSGHLMMLALSETPNVELFGYAPFPGRTMAEVQARCKKLAGGTEPPSVVILTAEQIRPWLEERAKPVSEPPKGEKKEGEPREPGKKETVLISYGQEDNRAAAEKLAGFLRQEFGIVAETTEQSAVIKPGKPTRQTLDFEKPIIFIGDEWTNNDLAVHGSYWDWPSGGDHTYGAHMPFTASYIWPGPGRAVVSLSRPYALIDANGVQVSWSFQLGQHRIRPVEPRFPLVRRKLHIAANGQDALRAVDALIKMLAGKVK